MNDSEEVSSERREHDCVLNPSVTGLKQNQKHRRALLKNERETKRLKSKCFFSRFVGVIWRIWKQKLCCNFYKTVVHFFKSMNMTFRNRNVVYIEKRESSSLKRRMTN